MTADEIEKILCPQCLAELDALDIFCRHCGARTDAPGPSSQAPGVAVTPKTAAGQRKPGRDLAESRGMVLLLLFAVLGPLALPVLWRSSKFSQAGKIFLTILVLIVTVLVVWLLWYAIHQFIKALTELGVVGGL